MNKANAIRFHAVGGIDVLRMESISIDNLRPKEVLVRHNAIGVNYIDTYFRSGLYPVDKLPSGLGMEAVGVIDSIGNEVDDFKEGDRVAYIAEKPGTYSELSIVPADRLIAVPDDLSDSIIAAALLKGMTVEYLIRRTFPVQAGQTVLWHAAAGGVGLIACQWLKSLGVTVIGTVGSEEKVSLARDNGCTHTIVYTKEKFCDKVMEITDGKGLPVVFDSVGKDTFEDSLNCLAPRGMMVSFGNASGPAPSFAPGILAQKGSLFITRPTLNNYISNRNELEESSGALFRVMQSSAVKIHVDHEFSLAEVGNAHSVLESRKTKGSIILVP